MAITDKEYLTFCNATNLNWQFAEYESKKGVRPKLHELLSPDKFIKRNEKGEITGYIYGATGNFYNEEKGLNQMRNSAGILMNYLEEYQAGNDEAKFLEKWEVENAIKS